MERVFLEPGVEGLGEMFADLIRGNLEREPTRAKLLEPSGTVNVHVTDAEAEIGLSFSGGVVRIGSVLPEPDLSFTCDAETLMGLTNVPLRFGMPDQLSQEGRAVSAKMLNGELKVKGLPRQLPLMIRLQRLFTVR